MAAPAAEEGNSATIDRILQPGHKFRNLNPFWVLGIAPTTAKDELKSVYRRLSLVVHPDRNPNDARAQEAILLTDNGLAVPAAKQAW